MMRYLLVLSGENIFFETTSEEDVAPELVIGFLACRLVTAPSDELAIAQAKRDLLVQWNQSFNADRKLGMPLLNVEFMVHLENCRAPKITHDYHWFTALSQKQELLTTLSRLPKKLFWQRAPRVIERQDIHSEDVLTRDHTEKSASAE